MTTADAPDQPFTKPSAESTESEERPPSRLYRWVDLFSAAMLALATVATAWSAYQSSLWGGEQARHTSREVAAIVRTAKFTNLASQTRAVHVSLFAQWAAAVSSNNTKLADFFLSRFPEPLKTATAAWRATAPLTNPSAPATPFDMPEYVIPAAGEALRWEERATTEADAAARAGGISERYLLFTIIFASVLFFAGISGKFRWQAMDLAVLALGALALLCGLVILFSAPIK